MAKNNDIAWPSFKKHYTRVVFTSIFFTLLQYTMYFYSNLEGEEARGFFRAFSLIYLFLISVLAIELHSLPYHFVFKKVNFKQFVTHFIIFVIVISYLFASIYNTIYLLDNGSFTGSIVPGFFQSLFDFFCFSVDFISGSGLSDIRPVSFWAKLCSILESFLFLYIVIILLSNFKDFGKSKLGSSIDIIND
ncbi:MAG: hypothetical protein CVU13_01095 [Bacteroidetes bacterium HGW-Bacteroidetes-8]|nr:MAG: hypothetical protein CVU13_01095 [Bacteroidetes bacterium HGW-Bacteroidetes-8]